jgi:WD40 repeat protein
MESNTKYFAFISYQREDEEWAKWLAHELEHYHLPLTLNGRGDLPKDLRPIFRDIDELSAGNLPKQIHLALENSRHLIVICSPRSASSPWVNKEIEEFINMGRTDKIFPFIIEGIAMCKDPESPQECFPPALRNLPKDEERLGANVNENGHGTQKARTCTDCPIKEKRLKDDKHGDIYERGRDAAVVKIVAGMLGLTFDTLWQRHEKEKAEEERKTKEQRDHLLKIQSRFVAEEAVRLSKDGFSHTAKLILLEVLPTLDKKDFPYTPETEAAIREIYQGDTTIGKKHESPINYADISHDGHYVVSASSDKTTHVWNADTGECLNIFTGYKDVVRSAVFSPDGRMVVSTYNGNNAQIWDVQSGKCIQTLYGHVSFLTHAVFSKCGNYIFSSAEDDTVRLWEVATGKCLYVFRGHGRSVRSVTCSHDGKKIVSASCDTTIRIWDITTCKCLRVLEGHEGWVNFASFSYDDREIVSASSDRTVRIWDADTGDCLQVLKGHEGWCNTAVFNSSGKHVLSSSDDQAIREWDVDTGKCIKVLNGHSDKVKSTFYCRGNAVVSASHDGTVRIWNNNKRSRLSFGCGTRCVTICHHDKYVVSGSEFGDIQICKLENGECVKAIKGHSAKITSVCVSPDSKFILSVSWDMMIRLWDFNTGECVWEVNGHDGSVSSASFNSTGRLFVASFYGPITIFDTLTGQRLKEMEDTSEAKYAMFSPDDCNIVSAHENGDVCVWDSKTGERQMILKGHEAPVYSTVYSHDGKYIISSSLDRTARIWDSRTGECLSILKEHTWPVNTAVFSHDDKYVATASMDETIRIWHVLSGRCVYMINERSREINGLAFSSDDRILLSAAGSVNVWDFPSFEDIVQETNDVFSNRKLTPEERVAYYLD